MPQLAPLSWILMSLFLFIVLFSVGCFVWWADKSTLNFEGSGEKESCDLLWSW